MTHSSLPPMVCTGEGPQMSECTSAPKASACGASHSLRMALQVVLAYSHKSHTKVVTSSVKVSVTLPLNVSLDLGSSVGRDTTQWRIDAHGWSSHVAGKVTRF